MYKKLSKFNNKNMCNFLRYDIILLNLSNAYIIGVYGGGYVYHHIQILQESSKTVNRSHGEE